MSLIWLVALVFILLVAYSAATQTPFRVVVRTIKDSVVKGYNAVIDWVDSVLGSKK